MAITDVYIKIMPQYVFLAFIFFLFIHVTTEYQKLPYNKKFVPELENFMKIKEDIGYIYYSKSGIHLTYDKINYIYIVMLMNEDRNSLSYPIEYLTEYHKIINTLNKKNSV